MKRILAALMLSLSLASNQPALAAEPTPIILSAEPLTIVTKTGKAEFMVEMAKTPEEQQIGLMNRKELAENGGMLFVLPGDHNIDMWMKDTLIPLDMLFLDSSGTIVYIAPNAPPLSLDMISAGRPVRAVLELKGGAAARQRIKFGDKVIHPAFTP